MSDNTTTNGTVIIDDTSAFISALTFSLFMFGVCIVVWIILAFCFKKFYFYKSYKYGFPPVPKNPIEAAKVIWNVENEDIVKSAGSTDSVEYIYFLRLIGTFFSILTALSIPMFFVNGFSPHAENYAGINLVSMASLAQGLDIYWIHMAYVFFVALGSLVMIWQIYERGSDTRVIKTANRWKRTVMIKRLPHQYRNRLELTSYLQEVFGDSIIKVINVPIIPESLLDLKKEVSDLHELLELYQDDYETFEERPVVSAKSCLCIPYGGEVDALEHIRDEIIEKTEILEEARRTRYPKSDTAFVVFDCVRTAQMAVQTLLYPDATKMNISVAPSWKDVNWKYLMQPQWKRVVRNLIAYGIMVLLFLFWTAPITVVVSISNLETLERYAFLKWIVDIIKISPVLEGIVKSILPSLGLIIFLTILPYLIYSIYTFSGDYSYSDRKRRTLAAYYLFLVIFTFFFQVAAVSILDVINPETLSSSPNEIISLLAGAIPNRGMFYLYYMMQQIFVVYSLTTLIRIVPLVMSLAGRVSKRSFTQKLRNVDPGNYMGTYMSLPMECMLFTISLTYSVALPIMLPFAAFTFLGMSMLHKYLMTYVYKFDKMEIGITRFAVKVIFGSTIFMQLIMMGIFALKGFVPGVSILIITIISIVAFTLLGNRYNRAFQNVPMLLNSSKKDAESYQNGPAEKNVLRKYIIPPLQRPLPIPEEQ